MAKYYNLARMYGTATFTFKLLIVVIEKGTCREIYHTMKLHQDTSLACVCDYFSFKRSFLRVETLPIYEELLVLSESIDSFWTMFNSEVRSHHRFLDNFFFVEL